MWGRTVFLAFYTILVAQNAVAARSQDGRFLNSTRPATSLSSTTPTLLSTTPETEGTSQRSPDFGDLSTAISLGVVALTPSTSSSTSILSLPFFSSVANPTLDTSAQNAISTSINSPVAIIPESSVITPLSGLSTPSVFPSDIPSTRTPISAVASALMSSIDASIAGFSYLVLPSESPTQGPSIQTTSAGSSSAPTGVPPIFPISLPDPTSTPSGLPTSMGLPSTSGIILSFPISLPFLPTGGSSPTPLPTSAILASASDQDFSMTVLFPLPTPATTLGSAISSLVSGIKPGTLFLSTGSFPSTGIHPSFTPNPSDPIISDTVTAETGVSNPLSSPTTGGTGASPFPVFSPTTAGGIYATGNSINTPTTSPSVISKLSKSQPTDVTTLHSQSPTVVVSSKLASKANTIKTHNSRPTTAQTTLATSRKPASVSSPSKSTDPSSIISSKSPPWPSTSLSPCKTDINHAMACIPLPTTSSSTSSSATTAAAGGNNNNKPALPISKSGIAGIAVAGTSALLLAVIAALYLLRRRHNRAVANRASGGVYPELAYLYDPPMPARIGSPGGPGGAAAATAAAAIRRKPVGSPAKRGSGRTGDSGTAFLARYAAVPTNAPTTPNDWTTTPNITPAASPPRSPYQGPRSNTIGAPLYTGDGFGHHYNASDDVRPHFASGSTLAVHPDNDADEVATLLGVPSVQYPPGNYAELKAPPQRYVPDSETAGLGLEPMRAPRWEQVDLGPPVGMGRLGEVEAQRERIVREKRSSEMVFADPRLVGREF